jgi:hypothetical protein
MTMKIVATRRGRIVSALTIVVGLTLSAGSAQAEDLAAWSEAFSESDRFVSVFDNEAWLDRETQLVWLREPAPDARSWTDARSYCLTRAAGDGDRRRFGWRLPSVVELLSVYRGGNQAFYYDLPWPRLIDSINWERRIGYLWTATSDADDWSAGVSTEGEFAYSVVFVPSQFVQKRSKGERLGVVCVRGPFNSAQY